MSKYWIDETIHLYKVLAGNMREKDRKYAVLHFQLVNEN